MIEIRLDAAGGKRIYTALSPSRIGLLVSHTAIQIERTVKLGMVGPKTGRVYKRGKKTHRASAPGESPAVDDGMLINSIRSVPESSSAWVVGVGAYYGKILEIYKTRPFLGPAVVKQAPIFEARLRKIFEAAI